MASGGWLAERASARASARRLAVCRGALARGGAARHGARPRRGGARRLHGLVAHEEAPVDDREGQRSCARRSPHAAILLEDLAPREPLAPAVELDVEIRERGVRLFLELVHLGGGHAPLAMGCEVVGSEPSVLRLLTSAWRVAPTLKCPLGMRSAPSSEARKPRRT